MEMVTDGASARHLFRGIAPHRPAPFHSLSHTHSIGPRGICSDLRLHTPLMRTLVLLVTERVLSVTHNDCGWALFENRTSTAPYLPVQLGKFALLDLVITECINNQISASALPQTPRSYTVCGMSKHECTHKLPRGFVPRIEGAGGVCCPRESKRQEHLLSTMGGRRM